MLGKKADKIILATIVLFFLCMGLGRHLSLTKPLWNDEIYTQIYSIDHASYRNIILGRIPEGNNCPLFYLTQKGICDLAKYKFPLNWDKEWSLSDPRSQIIMRINPNIFMSLSIVLIFYFFSKNYSILAGMYSLLLSFSSFMIWTYWAEARPYALWVFLTTLQSLFFLYFVKHESVRPSLWLWFAVTNVLLAVTTIFGAIQITVVTFLIAVFKKKKWLNCMILTGMAGGVAAYYYLQSPKMKFWVEKSVFDLISASFSFDQIIILVLYTGFFLICNFRKENRAQMRLNPYFILTLLMLVVASLILAVSNIMGGGQQVGFSVSNRYFIFLVPVGIVATTVFSVELLKVVKRHPWLFVNLLISLSGLLITRFLRFIVKLIG